MCQVGLCQQAERIITEDCGEDGLNKGRSSHTQSYRQPGGRLFQGNQSFSPCVNAALNRFPCAPDNELPAGQHGLGELLDEQLHAAVATWLPAFQFRSLNVDQPVHTSCNHTAESRVVSEWPWSRCTERSQPVHLPCLK